MAQHITIIGLGTLGQSIGLALRKAEPKVHVIGVSADAMVGRQATQRGAVEKAERWADGASREAGLVILAEPFSKLKKLLEDLKGSLPQGCVVTALSPLLAPPLAWADKALPDGVSFVAGHPILGPDASLDEPSTTLFGGVQYCVAPSVNASQQAMDLIGGMIESIGAQPFFLDPAEHDGLATAVDQLPSLLQAILMRAAAGASSWRDMRRVAGMEFARGTLGAQEEPAEQAALLYANRDNLSRWIDTYISQLAQVRAILAQDSQEGLLGLLTEAREARDRWLTDQHSGNWENQVAAPKVTSSSMLLNLLMGQRRGYLEDQRKH